MKPVSSRRQLLLGGAACFALTTSGIGRAQDTSLWPRIKGIAALTAAETAQIETRLTAMSVEEKVGQITMAEIKAISPKDVRKYHIGGLLNAGGSWPTGKVDGNPKSWLAMAELFHKASTSKKDGRSGIPVMWGTDAVHGHNNVQGATVFPHNIGLGAANDPALMRDIGTATAREVAATGIDWAFAPSVAVARDIRWGRTYESYSADPARVAALTKDFVAGLQGHPSLGDFLDDTKVIGTAKHFIGDGGTTNGKDQGDTILSEAELIRTHLPGYVQAIGAGIQTVMASFSSWNGEKLHAHRYLLTDILKGRLGFDGFVVGDWNGHEQIEQCSLTACAPAINAGVDMIMVPNDWKGFIANTLRQVESGAISMARLDDAVRRILRVKYRAGLLDGRSPKERALAGRMQVLGLPAHRAVARAAVQRSLVLLKDEGALPIVPSANLAVVGEAADHPAYQNGGWTLTWQGRDQQTKAINPAKDYVGHTTVLAGLQAVAAERGQTLTNNIATADTVIAVFAEEPYAEFEGDLKSTDWDVTKTESFESLRTAKANNQKTVALILSGRPRGMDAVFDLADAVVAAWLPGSEGAGIADVLLGGAGRAAFGGTLPFAWPKTGGGTRHPIGFGLKR